MNESLRVVARYADGRVVKGTTRDFFPTKDRFHLEEADGGATIVVARDDLKALFFVKSFRGDPTHDDHSDPAQGAGAGRAMVVEFRDGEQIAGTTTGYNRARPGFFLFPADVAGNNERIFVINRAVASIRWT